MDAVPQSGLSGRLQAIAASPDGAARRWLILLYAMIAQTAGSFVYHGVYVLLPFFKGEMGLSASAASLLIFAVNGGQLFSMYSLGRAIDRHGERVVVGIAMLFMGATCVVAGMLVGDYAQLLVATFVTGALYAAVQPGGTRAIIRWFPPQHRGLATGLRQSSLPLGTLAGALLLPFLATHLGWRFALFAQGIAGALGGATFLLCYRDAGDKPLEARGGATTLRILDLLRIMFGQRGFRWLFIAGMSMFAFQAVVTAQTILYLNTGFGMTLIAAASLFSVSQVVGIPGRIVLPWFGDRFLPGRREVLLGYLVMLGAVAMMGLVLLPAAAPRLFVSLDMIALGLGLCWFPVYLLQLAETAPKTAIAATVSLSSSGGMVAMAIAPLAFGLIVDMFSYSVAWTVGCLALAVPGLVLVNSGGRGPREES